MSTLKEYDNTNNAVSHTNLFHFASRQRKRMIEAHLERLKKQWQQDRLLDHRRNKKVRCETWAEQQADER